MPGPTEPGSEQNQQEASTPRGGCMEGPCHKPNGNQGAVRAEHHPQAAAASGRILLAELLKGRSESRSASAKNRAGGNRTQEPHAAAASDRALLTELLEGQSVSQRTVLRQPGMVHGGSRPLTGTPCTGARGHGAVGAKQHPMQLQQATAYC